MDPRDGERSGTRTLSLRGKSPVLRPLQLTSQIVFYLMAAKARVELAKTMRVGCSQGLPCRGASVVAGRGVNLPIMIRVLSTELLRHVARLSELSFKQVAFGTDPDRLITGP